MNHPTQQDLEGSAAIVTGASRGIGRAIALALARAGARVAVNFVSRPDEADATVARIRDGGGDAFALRADIGDLDQHPRLVHATLDRFGRVDLLVNNAALTRRQPFLDATPDAWDATLDVSLKGPYFLSQTVARAMARQRSGKIVNISSIHDERPMADNSIYNIAKAGLVMLTRSLALELAPLGIQVNCVSPGAILTDDTAPRLADPAHRERILARIPAGHVGAPEDVAGAVLLLASPASDYVTGATIRVDGGMLLL